VPEIPEPSTGAPPLRVEVGPEPADDGLSRELRGALTRDPLVRMQFPDADLWLVGTDVLSKEEGADLPFRAILENLAGSEVVEVDGYLLDPTSLVVTPTSRPRLPNDEEHAWARDVLRVDTEVAARLGAGEMTTYRPMPPLVLLETADGTVDRAVTVGLREVAADGTVRHRVVALRTADGQVMEDLPELPSGDQDCGVPAGPESSSGAGEARARVRVLRGEEVLWDLVVVRPSASSGVNGSGVELREVDYQRVRVLFRGHVPILNVAYDSSLRSGTQPGAAPECGPTYRDWFNEESCFDADGEEPVPGFRLCTSAPSTILERGQDGGGFRGVALWLDGEELVIVSQLQAGWYRYVAEWRLAADGTIRPRLGFDAVSNPCTCEPHTHHAYWRFDFDVVNADANLVQEHNEPTLPGQLSRWHTIRYETHRPRDASRKRRWRVRSTRSPHGYAVVPGAGDGTADHYGAGDVWIVAYKGDEVDDGQGFTSDPAESRARIGQFVSGEMVERADVVLWYGVHVRHAADEGAPEHRRVGPDLVPYNWRPPQERGPYIPIAPPPQEGPDDDDEVPPVSPGPSAVQ
jgi:hypothetical protein